MQGNPENSESVGLILEPNCTKRKSAMEDLEFGIHSVDFEASDCFGSP